MAAIVILDDDELAELRIAAHVYRSLIERGSSEVARREVSMALNNAQAKIAAAADAETACQLCGDSLVRCEFCRNAAVYAERRALVPELGADRPWLGLRFTAPPMAGETITVGDQVVTFEGNETPEQIDAKMAEIGYVRTGEVYVRRGPQR